MNRRAFLTGAAALGLGAAASTPALAQSFPSNVIRIVVPNSASTPPDILARIVANALSDGEGWKVDRREQAGRRDDASASARCSSSRPTATRCSRSPRRSRRSRRSCPTRRSISRRDFAPVIRIGTGYNVLVVNPSVPVHSVAELIDLSQEGPGQAHVLVGRLRHARASARRDVQARDRRAGDARALQPVPAGDRATCSAA